MPTWIESTAVRRLSFKALEDGLNVGGVNTVLDDHRDGKDPGKWYVHPNK
jgi:hypothetical protein